MDPPQEILGLRKPEEENNDTREDFSINVASRDDLIKLKKINRPQDKMDLSLLEEKGKAGGADGGEAS